MFFGVQASGGINDHDVGTAAHGGFGRIIGNGRRVRSSFVADDIHGKAVGPDLELFDGRDDAALEKARSHWQAYKDGGHELTYWRQGERGGWQKQDL